MRLRIFLLVLCLAACSEQRAEKSSEVDRAGPLQVYAVNYPLAWAAGELVGDAAEVHFDLPAGIDPAYWEPAVELLTPWQEADLILLNGAGYASWLGRVSLRGSTQVETSQAFSDDLIPAEAGPVHSHGPTGEHSHGAMAFTLWLDLEQFGLQVQAVADALGKRMPEATEAIVRRNQELQQQLKLMDERLARLGESLASAPLLYSHPVYQYLNRRYQLNGVAVHWEPDQVLGSVALAQLDEILAGHPARLMLWEDEPLAETRAALEQRGIEVVVYQPMGNRPVSGDFVSVMQTNINALETAVSRINTH